MSNHIPYHPAKGIMGLMPGWVELPSLTNPVTYVAPGGSIGMDSTGSLTPTFGLGKQVPRLGAFMAARFPVPQNPVKDGLRKGVSGLGCGCGCGGDCGCGSGMGQVDFNFSDIVSGNAGTETYLILGGLALAAWWLTSGSGKARTGRKERAERSARVASARAAYFRAME